MKKTDSIVNCFNDVPVEDKSRATDIKLGDYIDKTTDRYLHIQGVKTEMENLLVGVNVTTQIRRELLLAAQIHDIGYSSLLNETGFHPLDGAVFAYEHHFSRPVVSAVLFHTGAFVDVERAYPDLQDIYRECQKKLEPIDNFFINLVTYCDLHRSSVGKRVTLDERIKGVAEKYGEHHEVYQSMSQKRLYFEKLIYRVDKWRKK